MIEVLNLGAGVQSSTVLLMSLDGQLPKIDYAIFADTGWEPREVYRQMDWLEGLAVDAGITVHRVRTGNIKDDVLRYQLNHTDDATRQLQKGVTADGETRWGSMPLYVLGPNGERGQIRRQCTYEYKIRCIDKCIRREVLGLKPRQRAPKEPVIRQWFGISHDERQRMRLPEHKFTTYWYPLVELRMTRTLCKNWLEDQGYPEAPRSACIGCPYKHNREWRHLKETSPGEWQEAVDFDHAIRNCGGMRGQVFLHSQRVPLDQANLWTDQDKNQLPLFADECAGMCGV